MTVAWNASHILAIGGGGAGARREGRHGGRLQAHRLLRAAPTDDDGVGEVPNQHIQWLRHATSGVLSRTRLRRPPWSSSVATGIETNLSAVFELRWDQPHLSALRQARDKLVAVLDPAGDKPTFRPSGRYRDKPAGVSLNRPGTSRTFRPSDIHITSLCSSAKGVTAIAPPRARASWRFHVLQRVGG